MVVLVHDQCVSVHVKVKVYVHVKVCVCVYVCARKAFLCT